MLGVFYWGGQWSTGELATLRCSTFAANERVGTLWRVGPGTCPSGLHGARRACNRAIATPPYMLSTEPIPSPGVVIDLDAGLAV